MIELVVNPRSRYWYLDRGFTTSSIEGLFNPWSSSRNRSSLWTWLIFRPRSSFRPWLRFMLKEIIKRATGSRSHFTTFLHKRPSIQKEETSTKLLCPWIRPPIYCTIHSHPHLPPQCRSREVTLRPWFWNLNEILLFF